MNRSMEWMAELTASRDREMLDRRMALVLVKLFRAHRVTLASLVGDGALPHWQTRLSFVQGEAQSAWEVPDLDTGDHPGPDDPACWLAGLRTQRLWQRADDPLVLLWPLPAHTGLHEMLEVRVDAALSPQDRDRLATVLRIYSNLAVLLDGCERDALTGLLNRGSFEKTLLRSTLPTATDRVWSVDRREDRRPVQTSAQWLGVLDIDHFKQVNDVHGHLIGDEVLVLVARIMGCTFRACDRLYRYGGEEFAVLLSAPDELSAGAAFERFRSHLETFAFPRVDRVTASIGFTGLRRGDLPQAAFDRADRAVYHGKKNGRNQVHSFEALVAQSLLQQREDRGTIELFSLPGEVSVPAY